MKEPEVKTKVLAWLSGLYEFVQPEFVTDDGALDFLAANWQEPGYLPEIIGVECKGEATAAEVWKIANEQLGRYARCVPRLYFACSLPAEKQQQAFIELCRVASVGFVGIGPSGPVVTNPPFEIGPRLRPEQYLEQVRSVVAMLMVFEGVFGAENVRRARDWCSTKEPNAGAQWNAFVENGCCHFGVNIENARTIFASADLSVVAGLIAKLPSEARGKISELRYFGPGRHSELPLVRCQASMLTIADLEYVKELSRAKTIHVGLCLPIWTTRDAFTRTEHHTRMLAAQDTLTDLRAALTK